jgi:hypothetical protein
MLASINCEHKTHTIPNFSAILHGRIHRDSQLRHSIRTSIPGFVLFKHTPDLNSSIRQHGWHQEDVCAMQEGGQGMSSHIPGMNSGLTAMTVCPRHVCDRGFSYGARDARHYAGNGGGRRRYAHEQLLSQMTWGQPIDIFRHY